MMYYCEVFHADRWWPRLTDDNRPVQQGGKEYVGRYGPLVRGLKKIDPEHRDWSLEVLQGIYGVKE